MHLVFLRRHHAWAWETEHLQPYSLTKPTRSKTPIRDPKSKVAGLLFSEGVYQDTIGGMDFGVLELVFLKITSWFLLQ